MRFSHGLRERHGRELVLQAMSEDAGVRPWTFGSLFAGIGGIDLGLERAGWSCRWQVEIDPYCLAVLRKHWPNVPKFGDVKALTGEELEQVDLICGGFPCQPVSVAGKRKAQADERWLWPEFARIIRVVRPIFILVENVPNLLNINGGTAMQEVLGSLAENGYDAEWDCLPAAAFGAPHIRYRLFIVAYPRGSRRQQISRSAHANESENEGRPKIQTNIVASYGERSRARILADSMFSRQQRRGRASWIRRRAVGEEQIAENGGRKGSESLSVWQTEPGVARMVDGIPDGMDRLHGLGNAVVPRVAEWVGRRIIEAVKN